MQLSYPTQNPFDRAHVLRPQSNLSSSNLNSSRNIQSLNQTQYLTTRQHYPLNIWNFRDDHNSRLNPLDYPKKSSTISQFQKKILLTSNSISRKQYQNHPNHSKYNLLQSNPFYRKNLLISKQKIQQAIQKDLNTLNYNQYHQNHSNKYDYYQTPKSFTSINQSVKYSNYKIPSSNHIIKNQWNLPNQYDHQPNRIQYRDSFHYQSSKHEQDFSPKKPPLPSQQDQQRLINKRSENNSYRSSGKSSHRKHNDFKSQITVKGQRYYRTKVFPVNP